MGKVIAGMTMSLDGYINDRHANAAVLSPDFEALVKTASFAHMIHETGAVIMGRNTYEMADPFEWVNDDYEFQVPLFVLTHRPPENFPAGNDKLSITFVTDGIEKAVERAKHVAGDKNIQIIGGADTIQQSLNAGLCDELQIDVMPVLVGDGLRLFEYIDTDKISLERVTVEQVTPQRTSLSFKVKTTT
jgi:dihydrofolate reductase